MGKLTPDERRRVFLAQERTRQIMLARMSVATPADNAPGGCGRRRGQQALRAALIFALFAGGVAFYEFVEFHPPASLAEALPLRP